MTNKYNLKAKFDYYNKLLFENKLPDMPLEFNRSKRNLGTFTINRSRRTKMLLLDTAKIYITSVYDMPEDLADAILIHEMIHAWVTIIEQTVENNGGHGPRFHAKLKEVNSKVPFNVPVTEDVSNIPVNNLVEKEYVVIITQIGDKDVYAIVGRTSYNRYYAAYHDYFDNRKYPAKIYRITSNVWSEMAIRNVVQNPRSLYKLSYYKLADDKKQELLADLEKNGKSLYNKV